jgi:hypothetical protein
MTNHLSEFEMRVDRKVAPQGFHSSVPPVLDIDRALTSDAVEYRRRSGEPDAEANETWPEAFPPATYSGIRARGE